MRVCRAWGKDKHWLDRQPPKDRRDYTAAYLLERMNSKDRAKMVARDRRAAFDRKMAEALESNG